ncbi:MAG: hypothetical protein DJ555_04365 [Desulfurococcaceae archaeon]|nr:MAG: hypothetical protein DJ555_04365 [Desulfurococcaceae archaeon]
MVRSLSITICFRISRELKEKMDRMRHINWNEVVEKAIIEEIRRQEMLLSGDPERALRASILIDSLRRKAPSWDSVKEIRRWREARSL